MDLFCLAIAPSLSLKLRVRKHPMVEKYGRKFGWSLFFWITLTHGNKNEARGKLTRM